MQALQTRYKLLSSPFATNSRACKHVMSNNKSADRLQMGILTQTHWEEDNLNLPNMLLSKSNAQIGDPVRGNQIAHDKY